MSIVSPITFSSEEYFLDVPPVQPRADDQAEPIQSETPPKQADVLEVMQGNDNLARAAHPSTKKRGCCGNRSPKKDEQQHNTLPLNTTEAKPTSQSLPDVEPNATHIASPSYGYSIANLNPLPYIVSAMLPSLGYPFSFSQGYVDQPEENREIPRIYEDFQRETPVTDAFGLANSNNVPTTSPSEEPSGECTQNQTPLQAKSEDQTPLLHAERQASDVDIPPVASCSPQPDLLDESTWQEMPPIISSPPTTTPLQTSTVAVNGLQLLESSQGALQGGHTVEVTTRTAIGGNPALLQEAGEALHALYAKPTGSTFSIRLADGTKKEFYRSQYGLQTFLSAGQKLAIACGYSIDVTASLEQPMNGKAYACIMFRKRIDHAQMTYRKLRRAWNIQEAEKPLTFADPFLLGKWGIHDSASKIDRLELARAQAIKAFCQELRVGNAPKDPAFEYIYHPTYEQRRKLLEGCSDVLEYIAATDCVLFRYRPVPVGQ